MPLYERMLRGSGDQISILAFSSMLQEYEVSLESPVWRSYIINAFNLDAGEQAELDEMLAFSPSLNEAQKVLMIADARIAPYDTPEVVRRRLLFEAPILTLVTPADASSTADTTPTFSGAAGDLPGDETTVTVTVHRTVSGDPVGGPVQILETERTGATWTVDASPPLALDTYQAVATQSTVWQNQASSNTNDFTITA